MKADIKKFSLILFAIFICGLITLSVIFILLLISGISLDYYMRETNILQRIFAILGAGLPLYFIFNKKINNLNKKRRK